ncbi:hypothetical protein ACT4XR_20110 (plasmid) [Acinetobacter baumannii]|uniref:hypothetical protein n=1 Tax=Acinetobacter baumannii TaxID=470 RepID=UPI003891D173
MVISDEKTFLNYLNLNQCSGLSSNEYKEVLALKSAIEKENEKLNFDYISILKDNSVKILSPLNDNIFQGVKNQKIVKKQICLFFNSEVMNSIFINSLIDELSKFKFVELLSMANTFMSKVLDSTSTSEIKLKIEFCYENEEYNFYLITILQTLNYLLEDKKDISSLKNMILLPEFKLITY